LRGLDDAPGVLALVMLARRPTEEYTDVRQGIGPGRSVV
jgi:hypothetical protein